jgi:zinc transporter ZupT
MLNIFFYSLLTALATWLGALPFIWKKNIGKEWHAKANALAASLMLAASFWLIYEWVHYIIPWYEASNWFIGIWWSSWWVVIWILCGLAFITAADTFLSRNEDLHIENIHGADAKKVLLILWVMTVHSFAEWVAIGVSFGPSLSFGIFIALAIALHNIPEGLAISSVMTSKWIPRWKAWMWSIFSSLPQPLMAIPAYYFVQQFAPFLPTWLGFAAGAMIWMVISELLPDAYEWAPKETIATIVTVGVAGMILFQGFIG